MFSGKQDVLVEWLGQLRISYETACLRNGAEAGKRLQVSARDLNGDWYERLDETSSLIRSAGSRFDEAPIYRAHKADFDAGVVKHLSRLCYELHHVFCFVDIACC